MLKSFKSFLVAAALPLLAACSIDSSPLESNIGKKEIIRIRFPEENAVLNFGEPVEVLTEFDEAAGVDFYINGYFRERLTAAPYDYMLQGLDYRLGQIKVTARAELAGGEIVSDSVQFEITSVNTPVYGFEILESFPHDNGAFTQGLIYVNGTMYESTGLYGQSTLRRVDLLSGDVLQQIALDPQYFAEGLTLWQDRLIQLTWRERTGFVYDRETFDSLASFSYNTEGWGLTHDGTRLIMSDGSSRLRMLDPQNFQELSTLDVRDQGTAVRNLNELEFFYGDVFANIWRSTRIARISMDSGEVIGWLDLTAIATEHSREGVLNGIAFDEIEQRLFITGKRWTNLYHIRVVAIQEVI